MEVAHEWANFASFSSLLRAQIRQEAETGLWHVRLNLQPKKWNKNKNFDKINIWFRIYEIQKVRQLLLNIVVETSWYIFKWVFNVSSCSFKIFRFSDTYKCQEHKSWTAPLRPLVDHHGRLTCMTSCCVHVRKSVFLQVSSAGRCISPSRLYYGLYLLY